MARSVWCLELSVFGKWKGVGRWWNAKDYGFVVLDQYLWIANELA